MYFVHEKMKLWLGYRYTTKEIIIPRCEKCYKKHKRYSYPFVFAMLLGFIGWFLYNKNSEPKITFWENLWTSFWLNLFVIILPLSFIANIFCKKIIKIPSEEDFDDYPLAQELLQKGWLKSKPDPANAKISKEK